MSLGHVTSSELFDSGSEALIRTVFSNFRAPSRSQCCGNHRDSSRFFIPVR
jgi:hypothetical protein